MSQLPHSQVPDEVAISVQDLTKVFKDGKEAVRGLSFSIMTGESVAFLGPNGAGKSTTIKMLCGILSPSSGSATLFGNRAGSNEAARRLGLVFGTRSQLHMHLTVAQCLDLVAEIYYLSGPLKRSRMGHLSEFFGISHLLPKRVRTLSLGERMKCEVVAALLHHPRVLLLDEPTIGLDIVAKNQFRELLLQWLTAEKATLLLTSHDLLDAERLCDRCLLIDEGELKFDGPLDRLKGSSEKLRRVQVTTRSPGFLPPTTELPAGLSILQTRTLLTEKETREPFLHAFEANLAEVSMQSTLQVLSAYFGEELQDISISEVPLEEIIHKRFTSKTDGVRS